jgi:hypothetical protein
MSSSSTPDLPEKAPDESSKLKTFLSILRKYVLLNVLSRLAVSRLFLLTGAPFLLDLSV